MASANRAATSRTASAATSREEKKSESSGESSDPTARTPEPVPIHPDDPEEDEPGATFDSDDEAGESKSRKALRGPPRASDRNLGIVMLLQLLLVVGMVGLAAMVWRNHTTIEAATRQITALSETAAENEQVRNQHAELKDEIVALRGSVAGRVAEDVIFLKIVIAKPRIQHELAREIAQNVHHYAAIYGQDPDLVLAMIDVESDFEPEIVSHMGAVGLMQVMPQWKQVLGIREDLDDIETSIKYGLQILGFYREMYKELDVALTAYNRGPGAVDAALMRGQDPKNKYAPRVLERYAYFRALNMPPS